ncbi:hypothetical protein J5N97_010022 [Dioscorea zingiberensis]|uniref:Uncharacterized protein n=1 Tax=Dioscorea zingiberensis TaxID=325984 RepID=A0A9D5HN87_9LILI|nr:hypothetical protein J5N97_010022 [Dioscorea zingiberensis]
MDEDEMEKMTLGFGFQELKMSYRKGSTVWVEDKDAAWVEAEVVDVKDAVESFERIRGRYTRESDIESGNRISPNSRDMEMNGFFEKVKFVNGSKILRIHKTHARAPMISEDLYHMIKKKVTIRKHLERNRKDKDSKFRLILVYNLLLFSINIICEQVYSLF